MQAYQDEGLISVLESNFELLLALLSFFFRIKLYAKTFFFCIFVCFHLNHLKVYLQILRHKEEAETCYKLIKTHRMVYKRALFICSCISHIQEWQGPIFLVEGTSLGIVHMVLFYYVTLPLRRKFFSAFVIHHIQYCTSSKKQKTV